MGILDEEIEVLRVDGHYAWLKVKLEDLPRLKMMRMSHEVRDYYKQAKRKYRERRGRIESE